MDKKNKPQTDRLNEDEKFPLPIYKKEDDIYNREKEVPLNDEDNPEELKASSDRSPGDDLDIPGAEADDADEAIGEEDEENNYYSLGGDRHEDLEEDNA